jgi:hypothetical protein
MQEIPHTSPDKYCFGNFHRTRAENHHRNASLSDRERDELDTRGKLRDLRLDNEGHSDSGSQFVWTTTGRPIRDDDEVTSE